MTYPRRIERALVNLAFILASICTALFAWALWVAVSQ